eukprot:jgi/Phyca11/117110/e_gw1.32.438.1
MVLHDYIHDFAGFHAVGPNVHHHQRPVCLQLVVALARLGHNGNGASVGEFHREFDIAIDAVVIYTARVLLALKEARGERISWPNRARRQKISAIMEEEGFPGCVH